MNQIRCRANVWFVPISLYMFLLMGFTITSTSGDEPKSKASYDQLEKRLSGMTNAELLSLAQGGSHDATFRDLPVSPDQLNNSLIKELAKRLETPTALVAEAADVNGIATADSNVGKGDSVDDKVAGPADIKLEKTAVETFLGEPFSTGSLELKFQPGHGPVIYPDQQLFLDATDNRAHYITFELSYQEQEDELTKMVDQIRVNFLLRGASPCQVTLSSINDVLLDKQDIQPVKNDTLHSKLLRQWWNQFSVIPAAYGREQRELKESLLDILARRFQLPGPWPTIGKADDRGNETSLEHQFERGIGMLFGIESVKLAMRADTALSQSDRLENADQAIPVRTVLQSVAIPQAPQNTWIEPIAMRVPAECFYLRTGSLANYRQFRQFLVGWGGSLNDIVSSGTVDHQSRERIEGQLGLSPDKFVIDEFDSLVADMALIGCDPMFADGAAIGIVFHARNSDNLANVLKDQRNEARSRVPESEERRVVVDGHHVSFLASDDNRIRSFYAIDGDFHLVTNSYHLLSRFLQVSDATGSLGRLNEFRYARDQTNKFGKDTQQQPLAMLYLSDPFFQNLVSPHYRIELTRRQQAAKELKQYQLAMLVAKAERIDAVTTDQLMEPGLLPSGFGIRPDGSHPTLVNGKPADSRRGALGYFLPIPDVPIKNATQTEVNSYRQFIAQYSQEWRRVDPVTVLFSRDKSDKDGLQQVSLDIVITPYAQQRYALLSQHLAPANDQRVVPMNDDLVSLDTSIRTGQGLSNSYLLYLGLRDDEVSYVFRNGKIELADRAKGSTYAKSNSYAAISPPSTNVLQLLASAFSRVQRQQDAQPLQAQRARAVPQPVRVAGGFSIIDFVARYLIVKSSDVFQYASFVSSDDNWMVASTNHSLRQDVIKGLSQEKISNSSQVRLRVKSLNGSKVEPYIQAYTYLAARKASAENAKFLNDVTSWLQLPIKESRDSVETVLGAQLRCPLGGDFGLSQLDGHTFWTGTQWSEKSYFAETKTPPAWRFAFLDWLRGLDLRFDINRTTLRAHIDMVVQQSVVHDGDDQWTPLMLQGTGNPVNDVSVDKIPVIVPVSFKSMPTWILGIQLQSEVQPFRIESIYPNSPASRTGLSIGDQILAIDQVKPKSSEHMATLIKSARDAKGFVSVRILREGSQIELRVPLRNR